MTATVVNKADSSTDTGSSITVTLPGSLVVGNLLVMIIGHWDTATPTGLSGWTQRVVNATAGAIGLRVYTRVVDGTEPGSYTVGGFVAVPDTRAATVLQIASTGGWGATADVRVNDTTTSWVQQPVTTTVNDALILRVLYNVSVANTVTWTWDGTTTVVTDFYGPVVDGYYSHLAVTTELLAAAGATPTRTVTRSAATTSNDYISAAMSIAPTAGAAGAMVAMFTPGATVSSVQTPTAVHDSGLNTTFLMPDPATGVTRNVTASPYNAVPNDTSVNNVPLIQAAINACSAGDEVYLPNGIYTLKGGTAILGKDGVTIRGQSRAGVVLSTQYTSSPNAVILIPTNAHNHTISGFTIQKATGSNFLAGIRLGSSAAITAAAVQNSRIKITDILVRHHQRFAVELDHSQHVLVENCELKDAVALDGGGSGYGVAITGDKANNCWVNDCTIGPVIRHAIIGQYSAHHCLVENCTIFGTVADAIDMHGEDEYSFEIRYNIVRNGIRDGTTAAPNGAGIGLGEVSGGSPGTTTEHDNSGPHHWVHHNEVYDYRNAFRIENFSQDCYIEDNYFHDCDDNGVLCNLIGVDGLTLLRNTCTGNTNGIWLDDCTNAVIQGNTVTGNSSYGLHTNAGTTGYAVTGNTFSGNGTNVSLGSTSGVYVP